MEKLLLIQCLFCYVYGQLSSYSIGGSNFQVGAAEIDHLIFTTDSDTDNVIFRNTVTSTNQFNFSTPQPLVRILTHKDNSVSNMADLRYLVSDHALRYYANNAGPYNFVEKCFCFLQDKYNFAFVQKSPSTLTLYPSLTTLSLGTFIPDRMVYGDGLLYLVGNQDTGLIRAYNITTLAMVRQIEISAGSDQDFQYLGNDYVAYGFSLDINIYKPSYGGTTLQLHTSLTTNDNVVDIESDTSMMYVATQDNYVCSYQLYTFVQHSCLLMSFASNGVFMTATSSTLIMTAQGHTSVYTYDNGDFVNNTLLTPNTTNTNSTNTTTNQTDEGDIVWDWKIFRSTMEGVAQCLIIESSNVGYHVVRPLTGFLEDFWFYKYHDTKYPLNMVWFMQEVDLLNQLRLQPNITNVLSDKITTFQPEAEKYKNLAQQMVASNSLPDDFYFMQSTKSIYAKNFLIGITFFLILKILKKIFCWKKSDHPIAKALYGFLKSHTRWWNLLVSLLELNLLFLTFSSFSQLLLPSSLNFGNKVNLVIGVMVLFANMMFSCVFYILLFELEKEKHSQIMLTHGKYRRKGFYIEMFFNCLRNFCRGAFTAIFIAHHEIQLYCLIGTSGVLVCVCFLLRKHFVNSLMFLLSFLYYLAFMTFDIILFIRKKEYFPAFNYQLVSLIAIATIFGIVILKILLLTVLEIISAVKFCKSMHTVVPSQKLPQKKKHQAKPQNTNRQKQKFNSPYSKKEDNFDPTEYQSNKMKIILIKPGEEDKIKKYKNYPKNSVQEYEEENIPKVKKTKNVFQKKEKQPKPRKVKNM